MFDILSSVRTLYSRLPHGGRSLPASFSHSLGAAWPLGERAAEEETDEEETSAEYRSRGDLANSPRAKAEAEEATVAAGPSNPRSH